jgi:hypothetical protein
VKTGRSNGNAERSKNAKSVHSKANNSSQQFKAGRAQSIASQSGSPSFSKANKHSQSPRAERSKAKKMQSASAASKKSGGGGHKGEKGDKGKGKDKG